MVHLARSDVRSEGRRPSGDDGLPRLPPEVEIACYLSHLATRGKRVETPLVSEQGSIAVGVLMDKPVKKNDRVYKLEPLNLE